MSKVYIPYEHLPKVVAEAEKYDECFAAAVYINAHIGLRFSELATLRFGQIKSKMKVFIPKQNITRTVTVPKKVLRYLDERKFNENDIIVKPRSGKYPMTNVYFNKLLKVSVLNAQVPNPFKDGIIMPEDIGSHTIRKTFARRFWEVGGRSEYALLLLQQILRHSSINVTALYIGITLEEQNRIIEEL